jgi:CheY-like chemotaxis protein
MRRKILLADDSITIQKVVNLTFSDEGIDVVTVGNGETAINKLPDVRPDIVLADVWMPGRDGYELCEYVKTHPEYRHLPVLLLVGAFEPFDKVRAAAVKADGHLTKPFESRALVATVKKLLEQAAPPLPTEAFTPPPPLTGDIGRTQVFGSSVANPKPVDSQPKPVSAQSGAASEPPPPTIKITDPSRIEDGRNTDLEPLIPESANDVPEPPPSAESVLELTLPEQGEPILVYPEPPPTLSSPIEPPTFASPEPPALGVTTTKFDPSELENIMRQASRPPTDTSPLELDDVIESTQHSASPMGEAPRDPLLDTFADVAESTATVRSSFDPVVETTAHSGTEAAFVSSVAGEPAPASTAESIPPPDFMAEAPQSFEPYVVETVETPEIAAPAPELPPFVEPTLTESTAPLEATSDLLSVDADATELNRTTLEVTSPHVETTPVPAPASEPVLETPDEPSETPEPVPAEAAVEAPAAPVFELPQDEEERLRVTDMLPAELVASMRAREAAREAEEEAPAPPPAEEPPPPSFAFELPPDGESVVEAVEVPPVAAPVPVAEIIQEPVAEPVAEPIAEPVAEVEPVEETPSVAAIAPAVVAGVVALATPMVAEAVSAAPQVAEESVEPEGPTTGEIAAPVTGELIAPAGSGYDGGPIPQAVIDDIVKRVVAEMSERVVREIAWEVVPDLAELLIKKHLATTNGAK